MVKKVDIIKSKPVKEKRASGYGERFHPKQNQQICDRILKNSFLYKLFCS